LVPPGTGQIVRAWATSLHLSSAFVKIALSRRRSKLRAIDPAILRPMITVVTKWLGASLHESRDWRGKGVHLKDHTGGFVMVGDLGSHCAVVPIKRRSQVTPSPATVTGIREKRLRAQLTGATDLSSGGRVGGFGLGKTDFAKSAGPLPLPSRPQRGRQSKACTGPQKYGSGDHRQKAKASFQCSSFLHADRTLAMLRSASNYGGSPMGCSITKRAAGTISGSPFSTNGATAPTGAHVDPKRANSCMFGEQRIPAGFDNFPSAGRPPGQLTAVGFPISRRGNRFRNRPSPSGPATGSLSLLSANRNLQQLCPLTP